MANYDIDVDFNDIYWSSHEKQKIAEQLYKEGYLPQNIAAEDISDVLNELFDSRSYSGLELLQLIHSLIANRCFITSDQIKRIKEIIE